MLQEAAICQVSECISRVGGLVHCLSQMQLAQKRDCQRARCPCPGFNWPWMFGTWMMTNCVKHWRHSKMKLKTADHTSSGVSPGKSKDPVAVGRVCPAMEKLASGGRRDSGIENSLNLLQMLALFSACSQPD